MVHKEGEGPTSECKVAQGKKIRTDSCNSSPDVPNQTRMPQLSKQMLNACPIPPMHIIVRLLPGRQSSIVSSNEWHNDMNPTFESTIMAPKIKELALGTRRSLPTPN